MEDYLLDLEISLVKAFGWSLHEIDETSIESLLPFVFRLSGAGSHKIYADQADWL